MGAGAHNPEHELAHSASDVRMEKLVVLRLGRRPLSIVFFLGVRELELLSFELPIISY